MCANWNPVGDITLISVSAMLAKESYADEHSITRPPTKKTGQGMIPAPLCTFRSVVCYAFTGFSQTMAIRKPTAARIMTGTKTGR